MSFVKWNKIDPKGYSSYYKGLSKDAEDSMNIENEYIMERIVIHIATLLVNSYKVYLFDWGAGETRLCEKYLAPIFPKDKLVIINVDIVKFQPDIVNPNNAFLKLLEIAASSGKAKKSIAISAMLFSTEEIPYQLFTQILDFSSASFFTLYNNPWRNVGSYFHKHPLAFIPYIIPSMKIKTYLKKIHNGGLTYFNIKNINTMGMHSLCIVKNEIPDFYPEIQWRHKNAEKA